MKISYTISIISSPFLSKMLIVIAFPYFNLIFRLRTYPEFSIYNSSHWFMNQLSLVFNKGHIIRAWIMDRFEYLEIFFLLVGESTEERITDATRSSLNAFIVYQEKPFFLVVPIFNIQSQPAHSARTSIYYYKIRKHFE